MPRLDPAASPTPGVLGFQIAVVHNFIRDKYRLKFPELESLVHHPIDYARVVQRIGNEMDLTLVDLDDILPAATVMVRASERAAVPCLLRPHSHRASPFPRCRSSRSLAPPRQASLSVRRTWPRQRRGATWR